MPISLALPGLDTRTIGEQMQSGMTPFLDQMNDIMRRRNDQLSRIGTGIMTLVTATLATLGGLQAGIDMVQVVNLAFLELMAAGSFAFLVLIFLKLFELGFLIAVGNRRLAEISATLTTICTTLTAFQNSAVSLLEQILAQLKTGITVRGTLFLFVVGGNFTLTIESKGPDWLGDIDLLKLLGLVGILGLALALLVGFVAGPGLALKTFTLTAIGALLAIAKFVAAMIPLVELLGKMSFADIATLGLGLTALALFVYGLAKAMELMNAEVMEALPHLSELITKLGDLAKILGDMSFADIATLGLGLTALALFVYGLAKAMALMNVEVLKALPHLSEFIKGLGELAKLLGDMSFAAIGRMTLGLAALGLFVYGLAKGLALLNPEILQALPGLSAFIKGLGELARLLGDMSFAAIGRMTLGLAALALFVYGLARGLALLNPEILQALPGLSAFIEKLGQLGKDLAALSLAGVGKMALGLAALALFVYGLASALKQLNPDVVALLPDFATFIDSLGQLGKDLAALSISAIIGMAVGLAALAGFVYILALALKQLTADLVANLPGFAEFIRSLGELGVQMSQIALLDLLGMALGLAALAGFVYLLALALNTLSATAVGAITPMSDLIMSLQSIALAMAGLSIGDLFMMAAAFALIAAFVYALSVAIERAAPGLQALADVLARVEGIMNIAAGAMNTAAGAAGRLTGALSTVARYGGFGLLGIAISSFQEGGMVEQTGPAYLHEGERVLTQGEAQAYERGLSAPAGGGVDQSFNINGGITVTINAEHLDGSSAAMLSDEIVRQLQEKLISLHAEQQFQAGSRATA